MHPLLFEAAIAAALASAPATVGQDRAAADALLPRAVELRLPPGPAIFATLQALLQTAEVPYGAEQAPPDAGLARGPIDVGGSGTRTIRFDHVILRDALDAVVREDSQYLWIDRGDWILIRAASTAGHSALDAAVPAFAASDASVTSALTALVDAIDPSRPRPEVGGVSVSLQGVAGKVPRQTRGPSATSGSPVAFSGGTLLEALTAIAGAFEHLSWQVRYDGPQTSLQNAVITLMCGGNSARAPTTAAVLETDARLRRLTIPVWTSIRGMLSIYSQRARIQFGLESVPETTAAPPSLDTTDTLDLTDSSPAEAVRRIVALDSRYEYAEVGGMFSIRPKETLRAGVADWPIAGLILSGANADAALEAVVAALGYKPTGSGSGEGGLMGDDGRRLSRVDERRSKAESKARTISLTLGSTTLREALNAICRAHGTLSWAAVQTEYGRGRRAYTITLSSYDAWSVSKTFDLMATPSR